MISNYPDGKPAMSLPPLALLMCRPSHYTVAYEINPWMKVTRQVHQPVAARQWQSLYDLLTRSLRVPVRLLRPVKGLPDLVFTANAGLLAGKAFIRTNFRHSERQGEEVIFERYFRRRGYRVVTLPRQFNFEGEGDALWVGDTLFLGFRFRTDATVHEHLSKILHRRILPLELVDKRFYHLDTCFCPLDATSVLWYPGAFDRYGWKAIETHVPDPVPVSTADALRFCCNALVIDRAVILHGGVSKPLRKELERRGFDLYELNLSEFLKAGGSAKCLVLRMTR